MKKCATPQFCLTCPTDAHGHKYSEADEWNKGHKHSLLSAMPRSEADNTVIGQSCLDHLGSLVGKERKCEKFKKTDLLLDEHCTYAEQAAVCYYHEATTAPTAAPTHPAWSGVVSTFCPAELYTPALGSSIETEMKTCPQCIQGCCMLEQSFHIIEYINLLRTCKKFADGHKVCTDDPKWFYKKDYKKKQIQGCHWTGGKEWRCERTQGDKKGAMAAKDACPVSCGTCPEAPIETGTGACDVNVLLELTQNLNECCSNQLFDVSSKYNKCAPRLTDVLTLVSSAKTLFKHCVNAEGPSVRQFCKLTEMKLLAALNKLNGAVSTMFDGTDETGAQHISRITPKGQHVLGVTKDAFLANDAMIAGSGGRIDTTRQGVTDFINLYVKKTI
jgi:hypothetical protein